MNKRAVLSCVRTGVCAMVLGTLWPHAWGYFRSASLRHHVPPAIESWVVPLRWNDVTRYHYGPQEFFQLQTWPESSPVCIFVGSHRGDLTCVDGVYGFKRWSVQLGEPLVGNIAIHEGYGYVMSEFGTLYKIGLSSGTLFWQEPFKVGVCSDIWVDDRGLYFLTTASELWRYNVETREKVWRYEDEIFQKLTVFGGTRPVRSADGKQILIGVPNGGVVAIQDSTGRVAWEQVLDVKHPVDDVDATPTVLPNGSILVSSVQSETQLLSKEGKSLHAWPFGSPRGGAWWTSSSGQQLYVLPSLDGIRLINLNNRQVVSHLKTPLSWGYPLRPALIGAPKEISSPSKKLTGTRTRSPATADDIQPVFAVLTYSYGPAILLNTETFQWVTLREVMTGFSAPPLVMSAPRGMEIVVLYSNFGTLWNFQLNLSRVNQETSAALP